MRKNKVIRFSIIFILSFILFFLLTIFSNKVLTIYDVTSARISPVLNPVLGIAFGYPAIIGCSFANLISDIISGYKPFVCVFGILTQMIYGLLPYYVWKNIVKSNSHRTRLDSPMKTIYFVILMLINSIIMGLFVGLFQLYTSHDMFIQTFIFAALNDFDVSVILGLPLMTLIDYIYSRNHAIRKRKLSFNEHIIVIYSISVLLVSILITSIMLIINGSVKDPNIWKNIFVYSTYAMNVLLIISILLMYFFSYQKKKHAKLKIIEKRNGTIFVDHQKQIEFVSYPSVKEKDYIVSKKYSNNYKELIKNFNPRYDDTWEVVLSNQKGCPMKCTFCDCPGFGFHGNVSRDEFIYQINTIIDNVPVTHTSQFNVDFMRMGEPTFNENILDFIEFDLRKIILEKVDADLIKPILSTMLPKNNKEKVFEYLKRYCHIKNEVYKGNAELQFSINTTDEVLRKKLFKNMSLSLEEISEIGKLLPMPKGNKYALNFPITKDSIIDADVIDRLFDKEKFYVKLTPIHQTFNAIDTGLLATSEYSSFELFAKFEKALIKKGFEVKTYMDAKESDDDSLTCGNLILSNISPAAKIKDEDKKKIGLVVAIEIDALKKLYPNYKEIDTADGFKLFYIEKDNFDLFVVQSGMGEVRSSISTQYLIDKYNVSMIINYGVVGGLTKDMKKQKLCLVDRVVHYKYDCSEFMDLVVGQVDGHDSIYLYTDSNLKNSVASFMNNLKIVTCLSGDKFISTQKEKEYLNKTFNGEICDMESSGIVLTCEKNSIPCLILKAVSDGLSDGAEGFYQELEKASYRCLKVVDKVLDKISSLE